MSEDREEKEGERGESGERGTRDRQWRQKEGEKMERERDPNSEKLIRSIRDPQPKFSNTRTHTRCPPRHAAHHLESIDRKFK